MTSFFDPETFKKMDMEPLRVKPAIFQLVQGFLGNYFVKKCLN